MHSMCFKNSILLFLFFCFFKTMVYCQIHEHEINKKYNNTHDNNSYHHNDNIAENHNCHLEIPAIMPADTVIIHTGFSLLYNEKYEQAKWVAYELTKVETYKVAERTNRFIIDLKVSTHTANNKDYKSSGYDKGHLAPAGDMSWSAQSMYESFYFSNISPQVPAFNRGIWKKLEELVRLWAIENEAIYIITGPIIGNNPSTIGANKVAVPDYYFKVILDYTYPSIKGIGFILPNAGSQEKLQYFALSIDEVEKITGIDFFPLIPDEQENNIEKTLCISCWEWAH